jgi:rare lipoprotein A
MAKMRRESTYVVAPPRRRSPLAFWLAGVALLSFMGSTVAFSTAGAVEGAEPRDRGISRVLAALPIVPSTEGASSQGRASWYGAELHGAATASGEPFDMYGLTAAHRTLPLGSAARVTHLDSGRSVVVRINDRGPHRDGMMIDLSYGAAQEIGMVSAGTARVEVTPIGP